MSETIDEIIYNFYDYMKTIFIYSHTRTYLIDPKRQKIEIIFDYILLVVAGIFLFVAVFKMLIIIIYFLFMQALPAFISFFKTLFKAKFKISCGSSCVNAMNFVKKIGKRIFTFNFYLYDNNVVGAIMILSYFLFIISSFYFNLLNVQDIKLPEKSEEYMYMFYLHFESFFLVQLLCTSFYACQNIKIGISCGFGIFLLLNGILIIGYLITDKIENVDGKYELDDPQKVMNIIFNLIFVLLDGYCLYIVSCKKKGKSKIINLYFIHRK
jgi:hypothetical protein